MCAGRGAVTVEEAVPLEAESNSLSGNAARQLADLVRLIDGRSPRYPNTLPTLADGARTQEVLEAALAARQAWAEVKYAA